MWYVDDGKSASVGAGTGILVRRPLIIRRRRKVHFLHVEQYNMVEAVHGCLTEMVSAEL